MRILRAGCLLVAGSSALAAVHPLPPPGEDLLGEERSLGSRPGDTLATIAYEQRVGFRQLLYANPQLDPWNLPARQRVKLPTRMLLPQAPRDGIVINVPEMRLYYFPAADPSVHVYPVAVGRTDWKTPIGTTEVRGKTRNPVWYPPESIRAEHAAAGDPLPAVVQPGPDNPLGAQALRLGWSQILIHGTNKPLGGIGMPVTHGCIRLYPEDMESLYEQVPIGTAVTIIDQPYKLGRHQGRWHLEAHMTLSKDAHARAPADVTPELIKIRATRSDAGAIDWEQVAAVLRRSDGMPVAVETSPAARVALRAAPAPSAVNAKGARAAKTSRENLLLLVLGLLVALGLLLGLLAGGWLWRGLDRRNVGA